MFINILKINRKIVILLVGMRIENGGTANKNTNFLKRRE